MRSITHPSSATVATGKRANPIADAIDPSDLGASDIDFLMQAARTFPKLRAFESNLPGASARCIFIATRQPTDREIQTFLRNH